MPKTDKKQPAKGKSASAETKMAGSVAGALHPGQTKPADAGRASGTLGGKGASSKKGR